MGHSLGVTDSYSRFSEEEMLEDYLKGVGHLTVNQNLVMIRKNSKNSKNTCNKPSKIWKRNTRRVLMIYFSYLYLYYVSLN